MLLFLSSVLLMLCYKKYKNESLDLRKLTSIPTLVSIILVSKLLSFLCTLFITRSIGVFDYGSLQMNLGVYKLIFGLFILTISCKVFYSSKRENKIKIAE